MSNLTQQGKNLVSVESPGWGEGGGGEGGFHMSFVLLKEKKAGDNRYND